MRFMFNSCSALGDITLSNFRKIITDYVPAGNQIQYCIDGNRQQRRHRNSHRTEYPPQRHPGRHSQGACRRAAKGLRREPQQQKRQRS